MGKPAIPVTLQSQILALVADGVPLSKIAKTLKVSLTTVKNYVSDPENRRLVIEVRQRIKVAGISALEPTLPKLANWLAEIIAGRVSMKDAAKAADQVSRSIQSIERTLGSLAGENIPPKVAAQAGVQIILQGAAGTVYKSHVIKSDDGQTIEILRPEGDQ